MGDSKLSFGKKLVVWSMTGAIVSAMAIVLSNLAGIELTTPIMAGVIAISIIILEDVFRY